MIWRYFFNTDSSGEYGTLYQLRNRITRTNVVKDPSKNFNACDDFFITVISGHVIAAFSDLNLSTTNFNPSTAWMNTDEERKKILLDVSKKIEKYVNFSFYDFPKPSEDKKRGYAIEILSLGCFYLEYSDAIKEGDGKRILRCWRYLLSIFYSSGHTNYANEVLRMLYQHDYILSPRHKTELLWGRFINVHGRTGKNIAADLHMEHLNRVVKECIKCLGANKTEGAIVRVGKALDTVVPVLDQFDLENDVSTASGLHNPVNAFKDHNMVANELSTHNIFKDIPHREHAHFPKPRNVLHGKKKTVLEKWMEKKLTKFYINL